MLEHLLEHREWPGVGEDRCAPGEVEVVTVGLAGQGDMEGVMEVVVPLHRHPPSAERGRRDHGDIVEVTLGDEIEEPAHLVR